MRSKGSRTTERAYVRLRERRKAPLVVQNKRSGRRPGGSVRAGGQPPLVWRKSVPGRIKKAKVGGLGVCTPFSIDFNCDTPSSFDRAFCVFRPPGRPVAFGLRDPECCKSTPPFISHCPRSSTPPERQTQITRTASPSVSLALQLQQRAPTARRRSLGRERVVLLAQLLPRAAL